MTSTMMKKKEPSVVCDKILKGFIEKIVKNLENNVKKYLKTHNTIEDPHIFYSKKEGITGLIVSAHVHMTESGSFRYSVHMYMNNIKFERWFMEHAYIFEHRAILYIGPIMLAHAGRQEGETKPNWKDTEFCIDGAEKKQWLRLLQDDLVVEAYRSPHDGTWEINRID